MSKKNYDYLVKTIIENIGGLENINSVTHCVTRLRFKLKDESITKTDVIKDLDGVVTVMEGGGQYQVVIGNHVPDVYEVVTRICGFSERTYEGNFKKKQGVGATLIDIISGVFAPCLGVLAATGMIKGLLALLVFMGWTNESTGFYILTFGVADAFFHFLPVFLGYTSAKKFNSNIFIGLALGSTMIYLQNISVIPAMEVQYLLFENTIFQMSVYTTFFGIPITWPASGYASSVIPIILSVFLAGKIEKFFKGIIPDVVKAFLVPMLTLLVAAPLTFIIVGPIASILTSMVGQLTITVYDFSPIIAGFIIGALWQVLVIFGIHWGLVPIAFLNMTELGFDPILAVTIPASFAQSAVVLAILIKTKDQKIKSLGIPAFISGMFGVTEPAIYGITLPRKKPFFISCIGASIGGALVGILGIRGFMFGGMGLFALPSYINPKTSDISGMIGMIVACSIAMAVGFILTWIIFKDDEINITNKVTAIKKDEVVNKKVVYSPFKGKVIDITEIEDAAFSSGALGKGVAITPTEGIAVSPVNGTVTTLFKTNHAIGIVSDDGVEILIHIGMDTVQLDGEHFRAKIKQGDTVKIGQPLVEFDIEAIKGKGYSIITPIVITNSLDFEDIFYEIDKKVSVKEELIQIL